MIHFLISHQIEDISDVYFFLADLIEARGGGMRSGERQRLALGVPWIPLIEGHPQDELTPVANDDREL